MKYLVCFFLFGIITALSAQSDSLYRFQATAVMEDCSDRIVDGSNKACLKRVIIAYVERHFNYPEEALQRGVEAHLKVTFTLMPDGTTRYAALTQKSKNRYWLRFWLRKYARQIDNEALRVIKEMELDSTPVEGGQPSAITFTQPIRVKKEFL